MPARSLPLSGRVIVVASVLGTVLVASACSDPDWMGRDLPDTKSETSSAAPGDCDDDDNDAGGGGGSAATAGSGEACCGGKGTCVPEGQLSSPGAKDKLSPCATGGFCVPEAIRGGKSPKRCEAANGLGEGVCLSECIKAIAEKKGALARQTCDEGEFCAPCKLGSSSTGACELGGGGAATSSGSKPSGDPPRKGKCPKDPATNGTAPPAATDGGAPAPPGGEGNSSRSSCCGGKGTCVPDSAVPEERRESLEPKTCADKNLCAPTEMIDLKNFKPKRCTGASLLGAYQGVCLSNCLAFSFVHTLASEQGDCDSDHRCLPCEVGFAGIFALPSGAPGCE